MKPEIGLKVRSSMSLVKRCRETGRIVGRVEDTPNTFYANGRNEIASLFLGEVPQWSNATMFLRINVSSGTSSTIGNSVADITVEREIESTSGDLLVKWTDERGTAYTVSSSTNNGGLRPRTSEFGDDLARLYDAEWGEKPETENWTWVWRIGWAGAASGNDSGLVFGNDLNHIMAFMMSGVRPDLGEEPGPVSGFTIEPTTNTGSNPGSGLYSDANSDGHGEDTGDGDSDVSANVVTLRTHLQGPYDCRGWRMVLKGLTLCRRNALGVSDREEADDDEYLNFTHVVTILN